MPPTTLKYQIKDLDGINEQGGVDFFVQILSKKVMKCLRLQLFESESDK